MNDPQPTAYVHLPPTLDLHVRWLNEHCSELFRAWQAATSTAEREQIAREIDQRAYDIEREESMESYDPDEYDPETEAELHHERHQAEWAEERFEYIADQWPAEPMADVVAR